MFKKVLIIVVLITSSFLLFSCQTSSDNEIIEVEGVNDVTVYLGDSFDLMENVTFSSSIRGDITSTVSILDALNLNSVGVSIIRYQTHYENGEEFTFNRRIVVLNAPDSANLIENGDFSSEPNYAMFANADYPSNIQYIIDPDLRRLQVVIHFVSDNIEWPHISFPTITLDQNKTYTLSMLVSGSKETSFSVDIVETTNSTTVYQVLNEIINPLSIDVGLDEEAMQLVTFDFTPTMSSNKAKLRLMFGNSDSSERIIYLDNIRIDEKVL